VTGNRDGASGKRAIVKNYKVPAPIAPRSKGSGENKRGKEDRCGVVNEAAKISPARER